MRRLLFPVLTGACFVSVAHAASVRASSELVDGEGVRHPAESAFDGLLTTGWSEGVAGVGEGSWIEIRFDRPVDVKNISLWPGDLTRGTRSLKENGRPHTVTISLIGEGEPVTAEARLRDGAEHGIQRVDVAVEGTASAVRLTVDGAYAGFLRNDTFLAEVAVNFAAGDRPAAAKLETWTASPAGEKAAAAHKDKVIALFDQISTAEFGDRDAMAVLMDWAGDGAPYLRERVKREVPAGFRVSALPPDPVAVEALLKLKDANAIPAIELASLRTTGAESRRLAATSGYFEAWAELKGGGRRSFPTWGVEGWEKGALRSFGEPMGVVRSLEGKLYIADVANNRVSVFDDTEGRFQEAWGEGSAEVTDAWFGGRRAHYVSGREATKQDGGFMQPVDVALIPGKEGDQIVVLDAIGKVRRFDAEGKLLAAWRVESEMKAAAAGASGAAHVLVAKGQIAVVWGNEGFVFDLDGNETARFLFEDGAPIDAFTTANHRLALVFRTGIVTYGLDGFRYAQILAADSLPVGYESWSAQLDEKKKLWVLTDHGWVIRYKKPGVEAFRVRWSELGSTCPRFVVDQDVIWVVHDGRIERIDVQERLRAEVEGEP